MPNYSFLMSIYSNVTIEELHLSVSSMLEQSVKPEQIVIVCDGPISNELTNAIEAYKDTFPDLFTFVILDENHGLAYALNQGLKECRNELVARMDSDDYSRSSRCEKQIECFIHDPELVIVGTDVENFQGSIDNILPIKKQRPYLYPDIKKALRRSCPFAHPSIMYKKSKVLACGGYDPDLRRRQDYDLFSKMINGYGLKAINIHEPLLLFRVDDSYYKRNKSIDSCLSRIKVQHRIYCRKECSVMDLIYIIAVMLISMALPQKQYELLINLFKSKKIQ